MTFRLDLRTSRLRNIERVGGKSIRSPKMSEKNPGVRSSAPAPRINTPSTMSRVGIRPEATDSLKRLHTRNPSRLTSQLPRTATRNITPKVLKKPMYPLILMIVYNSTIGTITNSRNKITTEQ